MKGREHGSLRLYLVAGRYKNESLNKAKHRVHRLLDRVPALATRGIKLSWDQVPALTASSTSSY